MALVAWSVLVYGCMSWYYMQENRKRKNGERDAKIQGLTEEQITALGDENPRYVFTS